MKNYPTLRNLLVSVFSVDVGLSEDQETAALARILQDDSQRSKIESELKLLFDDKSISWCALLDNDDYVVYSPDDEGDAKAYVVEKLWNRVFPSTPDTEDSH